MELCRWILVACCIISIKAQCYEKQKYLKRNKLQYSDSRIVNGREAREGEFPFMVALHVNGKYKCSASLIASTIVLTAAHCIRNPENGTQPASEIHAFAGTLDREGPETRIEFSEVLPHPDFIFCVGSEFDIAILRTKEPVPFNDRIQPICLPTANRTFEGSDAQAAGWGLTSYDSKSAPRELRTTEQKVINRDQCKLFYSFFNITITERFVCTNANRPTGICYGDSGSPLIYNDTVSGQVLNIGVLSLTHFFGCGEAYLPSGYMATAEFTEWLTTTSGEDVGLCFV